MLRLVDLFDQFPQLLILTDTHVKETDADLMPIMDGLHYTAKSKCDPRKAKFGFDARVDSQREWLRSLQATAGQAQINNAARHPRATCNKKQQRIIVHGIPGMSSALNRPSRTLMLRRSCLHLSTSLHSP